MKKIVLIEDRFKRQELFISETNFDFEKYSDIVDNMILDDFYPLANQIIDNNFNLSQYEIIICHKSVQLENENESNSIITSRLREYCKNNHKTLVFFSGGISANFYDNSELEILEINSKTFYSKNLVLFLDAVKNQNEDILMLCYGEYWKENIVANTLEETNIFLFDVEHNDKVSPNDFKIDHDLSKIDYDFYQIQERTIEEIKKFKQSLESFFTFENNKSTKNKSLVIHHNNICSFKLFDEIEKFNASEDIDKYISEMIIDLKEKDFEVLFIKDNLSSNYLELLGLRVAYHIRLSSELGNKRFIPIVIVSDFSVDQLCKFDEMANILFTPNIYLCKNTKEDIEKYQQLELYNLSLEEYNQEFLSKIKINPPKDTSGSHNIANKWSIYKWAEFLKCESDAIDKNKSEIENELYFKYLKAKYLKDMNNTLEIIKPTKKGNVLLIDDEWNKGWSDVLKNALQKDGLEFDTFEYDFKDKSNFNLIVQLNHKELKEQVEKSDVVVLDLRLLESDHENEDIDSYTGIKILEKIHEINAGIQIIMLTATSKSTILEKLYEKKILGYIKKEHPEDKSIDTVENINKFINLVDKGLEKKYLKEIWEIQQNILLNESLPLDIYLEIRNIFVILDSNMENKFNFTVLTFAKIFESVSKIYIDEKTMQYIDDEKNVGVYDSYNNSISSYISQKWWKNTQNRVHNIVYEKLNITDEKTHKYICEIINCRNYIAHPNEKIPVGCKLIKSPNYQHILNWFKIIENILSSQNMSN